MVVKIIEINQQPYYLEGLIMFISSKASTALGLSVGIAMSIHNLTEGFMIALPLYYATRSRTTSFTYAAIMGGFSQPLGALIGLFLIENISKQSENLLFGIVFGCVSGMMSLITIQVCGLLLFVKGGPFFWYTNNNFLKTEHVATSNQS